MNHAKLLPHVVIALFCAGCSSGSRGLTPSADTLECYRGGIRVLLDARGAVRVDFFGEGMSATIR